MKNKLAAVLLIAISLICIPWCYADFFPLLSQSDPEAMEVFAKKIRAIKINNDTGDEVMQKLGSPQGGSEKLGGGAEPHGHTIQVVKCSLIFNLMKTRKCPLSALQEDLV